MNRKYFLTILFFTAGVIACSKDPVIAAFEGFKRPSNFPVPAYHFDSTAVSKDGFELGRKLFYDPIL